VSVSSLRRVRFEDALEVMRSHALSLPAEPVPLEGLAGRILAVEVRARVDHPAFTNSAMDGYAVRAADAAGGTPQRLVGESRAGAPFDGEVRSGEAIRISTGAELPAGADAILRKEDAEEDDGAVTALAPPSAGLFVREAGEDVRRGEVLLEAGHVVAPHEVGVAAAAGHAEVACWRRPRVAIVGSGDEVVAPGGILQSGQVFDSNRPGVAAQARAAGAEIVSSTLVRDDREATIAALREALDDGAPPPDVMITIGGISVGPHDHLRPALEEAGVAEILFGVRIRPGSPLWLGRRGEQIVLGLPGNPVSAAVCFHAFGRPLLGRGDSWDRLMPLSADYAKDTPRTELIRCREEDGALTPLPRQGSHAVTSLAGATHLAVIPAEAERVVAGQQVRCSPL
jgi:molybdopterin molybdotransferase